MHLFIALSTIIAYSSAVVTTGASGNGVGVRLEIRTLQQDPASWNIYLLALSSMQNVSQSDLESYYQIARIHGYPSGAYDGVTGVTPSSPSQYEGYCPHRSVYFGTWHRCYVALFEQILQQHALQAANSFPAGAEKDKYVDAATNLRSAYWDWTNSSDGGTAFPTVFTDATVEVTTVQANKIVNVTMPNPLLLYRFHPNPGKFDESYYDQWATTLRSPTNYNANTQSQESVSRSTIDEYRTSQRDRLYKVLTNNTASYNVFGNELWCGDSCGADRDNIESIHDNIHVWVGGQNVPGHMTDLGVAAYDATFWLHHTMIDRAFSLWQALHPDEWFEPQTQQVGTFWYNPGTVARSTDELKPFKKDSTGDFWTSDDVRDWTVFNYRYPELPQGYTTASVRAAVDKEYGSADDPPAIAASPVQLPSRIRRSANTAAQSYEYFINVRANTYALRESYSIYAFLGEAGPPSTWITSGNTVGTQAVTMSRMALKGGAPPSVMVSGVIPLSRAIKRRIASGELKYSTIDDINGYLKKNLSWKVLAVSFSVLST
ncbi:Di-copper centre-containing protein [Rhizodiscina lignyota]|uniref:tyrosinase n=1 Tax=Rhizodiscina lignyota TaxID=1504668 RepID=A0A9P4I4W6_9PEZI|nr:Di-copper centre-containing protein [Rhizodiscina lignyota]